MPSTPRLVDESIAATGIRIALEMMLAREGGSVLPNPRNAPDDNDSRQKTIWLSARMRKYLAPFSIITGSGTSKRTIYSLDVMNRIVVKTP